MKRHKEEEAKKQDFKINRRAALLKSQTKNPQIVVEDENNSSL